MIRQKIFSCKNIKKKKKKLNIKIKRRKGKNDKFTI